MNFTELLRDHHIPYDDSGKNKNRAGWVNFECPYCHKDPYCGYNTLGRYCNCWNCGYLSLWEVFYSLGLPTKYIEDLPREETPKGLKQTGSVLVYPKGVYGLSRSHLNYLASRKFSHRYVRNTWAIRGIGIEGGPLRWRLFLPIHFRGKEVSWTTRSINHGCPLGERYRAAKNEESLISPKDLLYGWDYVRSSIIVVEGPLDAWAIGPGATSLMGLDVSPAQLEQISQIPNRYICFDNEPKAQERARKLLADLAPMGGKTVNIVLESGKDPAAASKEEIQSIRQQFLPLPNKPEGA